MGKEVANFVNCSAENNGGDGFFVAGGNASFEGCQSNNNGGDGYSVALSGNASFKNSSASGNKSHGFRVTKQISSSDADTLKALFESANLSHSDRENITDAISNLVQPHSESKMKTAYLKIVDIAEKHTSITVSIMALLQSIFGS